MMPFGQPREKRHREKEEKWHGPGEAHKAEEEVSNDDAPLFPFWRHGPCFIFIWWEEEEGETL